MTNATTLNLDNTIHRGLNLQETSNDRAAAIALDYSEYERFIEQTAKYPMTSGAEYNMIGLANEVGELCEKVLLLTGDNEADVGETLVAISGELGDTQWYVARYCLHVGYKFSDLVREAMGNATSPQFTSHGDFLAPSAFALSLVVEMGLAAGFHKKRLRDGNLWSQEQTDEYREKQIDHLRNFVSRSIVWCATSGRMGGVRSYADLLAMNWEKLADRLDRGTLQGSGDTR